MTALSPSRRAIVSAPRDAPPDRRAFIDPVAQPPDPRLLYRFGVIRALRHGVLPWRRIGGRTVVLFAQPPSPGTRAALERVGFSRLRYRRCAPGALHDVLLPLAEPVLLLRAEARVPLDQSCRGVGRRPLCMLAIALGLGSALSFAVAPAAALALVCALCALTLCVNSALKIAATLATLGRPPAPPPPAPPSAERLPVISLLVPLFHEARMLAPLLDRLGRLDYPRDRLDLCLIVEADDHETRAALSRIALPAWARLVVVPTGRIRTKPRALNYAMFFARGSLIGIYDAEDAPAPDQLLRVAARFAASGPKIGCLQGVLDYYNARSNWIARCFTLEYASWFRVVLPGLDRLGLVVPLGGTTLFLRRHAIEAVGGWDAHNVTEDADLGLRLARRGFRTELIDSVTLEEANARPWPWIKQRSRWLKGYAMSWGVAMHDPERLWRELGAWRFMGVQALFLGTLAQFTLAPVLWSFWLVIFGLPHPMAPWLDRPELIGLALVFVLSECVTCAVAALAARRAGRPKLALWAPVLQVYFPLATVAVWRALWQVLRRPFHWEKTRHGVFAPTSPISAPPPPLPRPASTG
ncbi:glycosyltransferase family 2 protein [Limimaricola hongkongensis]|uniref:Glycosyl transferase, group 2 family protein n=1 Tax=Limimaricola hongkongensis DSM 17492 TaxID=1122180 RepID=A0A017HAE2_9RHOB|nr:glycosyltransferase [Limimaricola hongkongensis]EYD71088.1 Glycosyl transferase, group 2 family protein [Limimaricola hongkongensis DSM 17492]